MNKIVIPGIGEIDKDVWTVAVELEDTIILAKEDSKPKLWVTRDEYMGIEKKELLKEIDGSLENELNSIEMSTMEVEDTKELKADDLTEMLYTAPFDLLLGTAIMIYGEAKVRAKIRSLFEEDKKMKSIDD